MAENNRVLVPVDFSQSDEKSIEIAQILAQKSNLKIDLIHVESTSVESSESNSKETHLKNRQKNLEPDLHNKTQIKIASLIENLPDNVRGDYYLKTASYPSEAINTLASDDNYSMIIMSRNEQETSGIFRSSNSEQVLRRSKVPVMILDGKSTMGDIKSILVPTDGSLLSMAAIPPALNIAEIFKGRITLFYVNEVYGLLSNHFSTKTYVNVKQEVIQYLFARLQEFLNSLAGDYDLITDEHFKNPKIRKSDDSTIPLRLKIVTGLSAHHEITKYANRSADFVVMATHGRSGIAQLIMGSHAEKVAQNINKPILTIRPASKEFIRNKSELKKSLHLSQQ